MLKKRPFCNTFTGCGRKRSEGYQNMNMVNPAANEDLTDIRRQLLSDARLWDILQTRLREENIQLQVHFNQLSIQMANGKWQLNELGNPVGSFSPDFRLSRSRTKSVFLCFAFYCKTFSSSLNSNVSQYISYSEYWTPCDKPSLIMFDDIYAVVIMRPLLMVTR